MSVPLIAESSGQPASDSGGTTQFDSLSLGASTGSSGSSSTGDRRELVTVHVGDGVTLAQEDLELLLVLAQTLVLLGWVYYDMNS